MRLRKAPERAGKTATEENNKHETQKKKKKQSWKITTCAG